MSKAVGPTPECTMVTWLIIIYYFGPPKNFDLAPPM